ncbi:MAG: MBL fold metallo-hydrolase [Thermomicrobiales bacterium]|nr:MBL fold metallo-hydrolase [Thermomicrobiales bacterium]
MAVSLEFLGTGTSSGVPIIGCSCDVCTSPNPHDQRLRASAIFRTQGKTILIDTSPDLRQQLLRSNPARIDAVLYTHMHSDHTAGLDDLRPFNFRQEERIPAWLPANAVDDFQRRFGYTLEPIKHRYGVIPSLDMHVIDEVVPFDVLGVTVTPIPVMHGRLPILGYRIGDIAYLTDILTLPEESMALIAGVDTLVTTALKQTSNPGHMSLPEALAFVEQVGARCAYFSHIGHELGREEEVRRQLPPHVALAHDGLVIEA